IASGFGNYAGPAAQVTIGAIQAYPAYKDEDWNKVIGIGINVSGGIIATKIGERVGISIIRAAGIGSAGGPLGVLGGILGSALYAGAAVAGDYYLDKYYFEEFRDVARGEFVNHCRELQIQSKKYTRRMLERLNSAASACNNAN